MVKKIDEPDEKTIRASRWPIILFDFDGTLVHSEGLAQKVVFESICDWVKQVNNGQANDRTQVEILAQQIVGRTWKSAAEIIFYEAQSLKMQLPEPGTMVQEWKKKYALQYQNGVPLIPGAQEFLEKLSKRVEFMGIVTGSSQDEVQRILEQNQLGQYFQQIWSAECYEFSKPHPAPYLKALSDLGAREEDVLVFEDSAVGMESAHQAGLRWVQVTHATRLKADPRSSFVIQDYTEFDDSWLKS